MLPRNHRLLTLAARCFPTGLVLLGLLVSGCATSPGKTGVAVETKASRIKKQREVPKGVKPLPEVFEQDFERLVQATEEVRGLSAGAQILRGSQDQQALFERLGEMLDDELPDELLAPSQRVLEAFGLVPAGLDLKSYYQELLSSQVSGYFDPETGYMIVVESAGGLLGEAGEEAVGAETARRLEEAVLVHEINHYLQDHHFNLTKLTDADELISDSALAVASLVEGDATLVMYSYLLDLQVERFSMFESLFDQMLSDPDSLALSPDLPGAEKLGQAPAYIQQNLVFPYLRGFVFASRVRQAGGQKLLDYAFREDPPRSTEQILHPEAWLGPRDEPIEIDVQSLEVPMGLTLETSGTWGELNLRLILEEGLQEASSPNAREAAAGWGGDRFGLWRAGEDEWFGWVTEWDTAADADEFEELVTKALEDWQSVRPSPTRVVSVWPAEGDTSASLSAALQGATLRQRPPLAPALEDLGIEAVDRPQPFSPGEMAEILSNPVIAGLGALSQEAGGEPGEQPSALPSKTSEALASEGTIASRLADPETRKAIERSIVAAGFEASQLEQLMKDPSIVAMVDKMLSAETPQSEVANGRFELTDLGFSLALPSGPGWADASERVASSSESPLAAKPALVWTERNTDASLVLMTVELPLEAPLELVVMGFEAGQSGDSFEKLRGEYREVAGERFYELELLTDRADGAMYSYQRIFLRGKQMIAVQTFAPRDVREEMEPVLREIIESSGFDH